MADIHQLPYLLDLLDDDTPVVRENVVRALEAYGTSLERAVHQLNIPLTGAQDSVLRPVLRQQRLQSIRASWSGWMRIRGDKRKLERAMTLIAELESGRLNSSSIPTLLDDLAEEFSHRHTGTNPMKLSQFLFQEVALKGVSQEDYYNPLNSNLAYVMENKVGIPISLVTIYILVGHRLGLEIEGCNLPGHFLAIAGSGGRKLVVDCYNGGRLIREEQLQNINAAITLNDILKLECQAPVIVARVLRNLISAYQHTGDGTTADFVADLLATTETGRGIAPPSS